MRLSRLPGPVYPRRHHPKAKRIAPGVALFNLRDAGRRAGGHRGDYLRIAPTDHLASGAAQPNHATSLRGPEAAAGKRDTPVATTAAIWVTSPGYPPPTLSRLLFRPFTWDLRRACGFNWVSDKHR